MTPTEAEAADIGVRPIGSDDEIEGAGCATLEGDVNAVVVLRQGSDRIAKDVVDVVLGGGVKDLGQVVAQELYVSGLARPGAEIGVHGRQGLVLTVNEQDFTQISARLACVARIPMRSATCTAVPRKSIASLPPAARAIVLQQWA